ncbi:MAG: type II toxin-antitoxin system MqsA family antitoxin [Deltaproteobacteria bacterium]|nr:type II toxin-antitoxin system MqsA family antitoxin [Deltaproteobacteria bacterium]
MDKICSFCGNKNFRDKLVQYIYRCEGRFLVVNNVPCEECEYCGEQYFMAEVLRKIEKDFCEVYYYSKKSKYEVSLPVEDFTELL